MRIAALLLAGLPFLAALHAQDIAPGTEKKIGEDESEEKESKSSKNKGLRLQYKKHLSLRDGKWLRIDFRAKIQNDFRDFEPAQKTHDEDLYELHRARVGIEGYVTKDVEFEVEYEIGDTKNPFRDLYVNYRRFRHFQLKAGKFKLPFGMEELTGPTNLDFAYRSRVSKYVTPAREIGLMLHGKFFDRAVSYQAGLFRYDGENSQVSNDNVTGRRTFVGRVTVSPTYFLHLPKLFDSLEIGQAFADTALPEGMHGLRGRTFAKKTFFPEYQVHGHRRRFGSEFRWEPGPFSVKAEFIHLSDQRFEQGLLGNTLPDLIARGWYVSGSWVVTGEKKLGGVQPRKDFIIGRGLGAVELATRFDVLRFGSAEHPGNASRGFRAANILGNSDRAWTFGLNWYWNRMMKVQVDAMRERIEDLQRAPIPGTPIYWVRMLRFQLIL